MPLREENYAALIGLDWANRKHDICLELPGDHSSKLTVIQHTPKAIGEWAESLRKRFDGRPVAVALELSKGPIVSALLKYEFVVLFPVQPATLARYRKAFAPSGAKDDPTDAKLLVDLLRRHPERLEPLRMESPQIRTLRSLVEARRTMVEDRVRITNRLGAVLKEQFPQVLDWFRDKDTAVFADFVERWPTLQEAKRARRTTFEKFFHMHNVRGTRIIESRINAIRSELPLTTDQATLETSRILARAMVPQLRTLSGEIKKLDLEISNCAQALSDFSIFRSLPGAGDVFAARLMAAFGEERARFPTAKAIQQYSGVAPVTQRSGTLKSVRRRLGGPSFLRQTFVEWASLTIPRSFWAKAFYQMQRSKGASHNTALRALAFKWLRVLWRCWTSRKPYDESRYLCALRARNSPVLKFAASNTTE